MAALSVTYFLGSARAGAAVISVPVAAAVGAGAAVTGQPTGISVSGVGTIKGVPDTLKLSLSVTTHGASVSEALGVANAKIAAITKLMLGRGVDRQDLQTSGLSISPDYGQTKSDAPRIVGYSVNEGLNMTLRSLATAGEQISQAVAAGGNAVQIDSISLDLGDSSALVTAARDEAFTQAKAKASQYAKDAGGSLGALISLTDTVQDPRLDARSAIVPAASDKVFNAVPIQPGSQNFSVTVTAVFALA